MNTYDQPLSRTLQRMTMAVPTRIAREIGVHINHEQPHDFAAPCGVSVVSFPFYAPEKLQDARARLAAMRRDRRLTSGEEAVCDEVERQLDSAFKLSCRLAIDTLMGRARGT